MNYIKTVKGKNDVARAILEVVLSPVFLVVSLLVLMGIMWLIVGDIDSSDIEANLASEFIGVFVTVVILGILSKISAIKRLRENLKNDLIGRSNVFRQRAIDELARNNWLFDGSLKGVHFKDVEIEDIVLSGAVLSNAIFEDATIRKVTFNDADLTGTLFQNVTFIDVRFSNTNLSKSFFFFCPNVKNMQFSRCDLSKATFFQTPTDSILFINCMLEETLSGGSDLKR